MFTEYEAKFLDIEPDTVRAMLKTAGATLVRPDFLQKRWIIELPEGQDRENVWLRVRDEGDKITMSWKSHKSEAIDDQKELSITVDNFDSAVELLQKIGCSPESYQETRRELWTLDGVEITVDTWPVYGSFVEVESTSEEAVRNASEKIGFDWSKAVFCTINQLFQRKFGEHAKVSKVPRLTFDMANPF
jgi:adenylate cyclase, class 2